MVITLTRQRIITAGAFMPPKTKQEDLAETEEAEVKSNGP